MNYSYPTYPPGAAKPLLPQEASPLFRLPTELRLRIFDHLFDDDPPSTEPLYDDQDPYGKGRGQKHLCIIDFAAKTTNASCNILLTCQRCRDEALSVFIKHFTLCINSYTVSSQSFGSNCFQLGIFSPISTKSNGSTLWKEYEQQRTIRSSGQPSPARVKIDFGLIQNLTILVPMHPILDDFIADLKHLLCNFPQLRILTLRVVYITILHEWSESQNESIMTAAPRRPITHPSNEFREGSCGFWYLGSYGKLTDPADRIEHWLAREFHRSRRPDKYKPLGALSANRVVGPYHDQMRQLLLKNVLGQDTYRNGEEEEGWKQFLEIDRLLMASELSGKSLSKLDLVLEGEMRVIRLELGAAYEEGLEAENHIDTFIFEVNLGIAETNTQDAVEPIAGTAAAAAAANTVDDIYSRPTAEEAMKLTNLRKVRTPSTAELNQRLQQMPLEDFGAYREGVFRAMGSYVIYKWRCPTYASA